MFQLRAYQGKGVQDAREALRNHRRVMLYSPTGSGKTLLATSIIQLAREKNKRTVFVCNRVNLVRQASRVLTKYGIEHGIVQADNTHSVDRDVLVCSIQTLARRGFPKADLFIVDEAHGCTSETYQQLFATYPITPVLGLSATPFARGLGREYIWGKMFEKLVVVATIRELIENDPPYLVDCEIYAPTKPDLSGVPLVHSEIYGTDYNETKLGEVMNRPEVVGDIVTHWRKYADGLQTIVFNVNIAHSKHVCQMFNEAGVQAEHVDCFTSDDEREAVQRRFDSRETKILCNVDVYSEGWDCPALQCVVMNRPTHSLIRWIQRIGRGLRIYLDKTKLLVLDMTGSCHQLGYPTDDLPLELDDGKPRKAGEQTAKEKLPHECLNCHFMIPAGVGACPKCEWLPQRKDTVETKEGELKKVARKKILSHADKQQLWSECLGLAQERKKSAGWASHLYRSIAQVWPRNLQDIPCSPGPQVSGMATRNAIAYAKRKGKP